MALGFRKFISEVFVNGKFPKISRYTVLHDKDMWPDIKAKHEVLLNTLI